MTLLAIPSGALALGAGAALAVGAAAVVLGPLWRAAEEGLPSGGADRDPAADRSPRAGDQTSAVDALREIEFDRATGKLSDGDYAVLKASYTRRAVAEMRAGDAGRTGAPAAVAADPVEAAIQRYRAHGAACAACGPRPEPDAAFCSSCGRWLAGRCARCGGRCDQPGQRYCGDCGHALAA